MGLASRGLGLCLALSLLGGCAVGLKDVFNDRDLLKDTQREFSQYLRWGAIEKASQFVVPEQRPEFEALAPHLTDLRFTDYEVLQVKQLSETEAQVTVRYRGYSLSSPIERSITLDQQWTRESDKGPWMVRLEVHRLREALGMAAG